MSAFGENFAKEMRGVATELLTQFDGRQPAERMAILKQGDRVWNPVTGEYEIEPSVKYFLNGVEKTILAGMVDGTTIQQGDKMITVSVDMEDESGAPIQYVPQVNDKMLIDGVEWSIVDTPHVDYSGAGLIVAYKMQVRK